MEFRKLTDKNVWRIIELEVDEAQKEFVATNTESIIEAYLTIVDKHVALPFGLYEDDKPVGFIMFGYDDDGDPECPKIAKGNYVIWRLMIDKKYQGQGLGKKAMEMALDYLKTGPCGKAEYCWISYEPQNVVAKKLYSQMGFSENGEVCDDEVVAVRKL